MIASLFRSVPDGTPLPPVTPRNPYRSCLGGGAAALLLLAAMLLLLAVGGVLPVGVLLAVGAAAAGTLFLVAWLAVGALQWRADPALER